MAIHLNSPWPYLLSAAFVAVLGWYAQKQPPRPGTRYFVWLVRISLVAALAATAATVVKTSDLRYALWALQILILFLQAPLMFMVALEYAGYDQWLSRRNLALLAVPALVFVTAVVILPRNQLATIKVYSGQEVFVVGDLVLWGGTAFYLCISLASFAVLVDCLINAPAFRLPTTMIIAAHLIPRVAYVAAQRGSSTITPLQSIVLATGVSSLLYFVALHRFQLLSVSPVARETAINHMPYGMLVLDRGNYLVDCNRAAQALLGLPARRASRHSAADALGEWWERLAPLVGPEPVEQDVLLQSGALQQIVHVNSLPLMQRNGWRIGQVLMLADVTQTRQAERQQAQTLWAHATLQEREQLAHELHDGLSQSLGFLNLQAQAAQVYLNTGQPEASDATLTRLTEAAAEIQAEARELIGDLLAVSQPAENFGMSLQQILTAFQQQTGLDVRVEANGAARYGVRAIGVTDLSSPVAVQLVRITQEALANVRKHACGARQVRVQLEASDGQLCMAIEDDGPGFSTENRHTDGKHFGLQVMRQRAAGVGGQLTVHSEPGRGTRVEVVVPLTSHEMRDIG